MASRVLIIDNAVHRWLFVPSRAWRTHLGEIETSTFRPASGARLPTLDRFTHLILTGSEASILAPRPWFEPEAALVREAASRGLPILGSCFGHQMLVYALSGSQWLRRIDPPEIGWADVEMVATDPLFDGLPNPWRTFVHHYDEVLSPPPPWRTLGRTRCCPTHVLRYGDRPIWGIQAHPEISTRSARFFLRLSLVLGAKPARSLLPAVRQSPPHHPIAGMIVRRFLAMEHGAPAG